MPNMKLKTAHFIYVNLSFKIALRADLQYKLTLKKF